jgi:hypothetical protein
MVQTNAATVPLFALTLKCRYITCGSLVSPLQKEVPPLALRAWQCPHPPRRQDYWTAHYFWRTWMPELHQQPFVLVVDTVAHGAAHAYVAKQITLCVVSINPPRSASSRTQAAARSHWHVVNSGTQVRGRQSRAQDDQRSHGIVRPRASQHQVPLARRCLLHMLCPPRCCAA